MKRSIDDQTSQEFAFRAGDSLDDDDELASRAGVAELGAWTLIQDSACGDPNEAHAQGRSEPCWP